MVVAAVNSLEMVFVAISGDSRRVVFAPGVGVLICCELGRISCDGSAYLRTFASFLSCVDRCEGTSTCSCTVGEVGVVLLVKCTRTGRS